MNYYYERKNNQYADKPKMRRIDSEKAGQVILAFYLNMPHEARNKKSLVHGEKYEIIFDEDITANKIMLPLELFNRIEKRKDEYKLQSQNANESLFILYSSYYILYTISKLSQINKLDLIHSNLDKIWEFYDKALAIVGDATKTEKVKRDQSGLDYSHANFFKTLQPKRMIDDLLTIESGESSND